jgi:flagellar basal-body rod modification protein FlgD
MSTIDAINGTSSTTSGSGLEAMGSDAFLKLFVAQLTNQNPMEPMDATQMMAQTAQFTMVENLQKISAYEQHVLGYTQMNLAAGLIGKEVVALDPETEQEITGVVGDVRVTIDGPLLEIGDAEVPLTNLIRVVAPAATTTTTTTTT